MADQPLTVSEATTRLQRWIEAIARDIDNSVCPFGILEHIQKHAGPDLLLHVLRSDPDESGPIVDARIWSASMHNLLAIFDQMFCHVPITPEEQLARLEDQHRRNPTTRTKEPRDSRPELDQERYG